MKALWQDSAYGLRLLAKSPGFAAVAILTLALGIGANTAIFSLVDAVMLRSLPVEKPQQLVVLKWSARRPPNVHGYMSSGDCATDLRFAARNPSGCSFSEPMFREIAQANLFSGVTAFANSGRLELSGKGPPGVIYGQVVSGDFFGMMGVKAALGRVFEPGDDSPSAAPVAVLNYGYWQSGFGGSREVIGRTIALNKVPFTIIGVAERRFAGITPGSDYDIWLPLSDAQRVATSPFWQNRQGDPAYWWLTIIGRLKPGARLPQAQAATGVLFRNAMLHGSAPLFHGGDVRGAYSPRQAAPGNARQQTGEQAPGSSLAEPAAKMPVGLGAPGSAAPARGPRPTGILPGPKTLLAAGDDPEATLIPAQSGLTGARTRYADPLYVLMLAVGIILLIACANVAGLTLARAAGRRKEIAVRLALGAGRARIARQLVTESAILAALGGLLGILFAYAGAHAIVTFVSSNQTRPLGFATGVDMRVLGFTLVVSALTGLLCGIAPAASGARTALSPALKEGERGSPNSGRPGGKWFGAGRALVAAQVGLAIVVLAGAGLLVRTLANLRSVDVGFDSHNIIIFGIDPTLAGYKEAQIDSLYRDLQGRLAETPGVRAASYSMMPLLSGGLMITRFHWPGTPQGQESNADILTVGPSFFSTLQIPLLAGRSFNPSDYALAAANNAEAPGPAPTPVVVNRAFAEKYLGKDNPLGKYFGERGKDENGPASPGYVIIGVAGDAKYNNLRREIHATMYAPQKGGGASFEVRTAADPRALLPAIRNVVARVNANLPLFNVQTESEQIDRLLFQERLVARISSFFGLLALVLACLGLFGLLSYEVSRRTREIGVRRALGAQTGDVLRLVVKEGLVLAVAGAVAGVGAALGVTRYLASMLYGVRPGDPVTIAVVAAVLTLVAVAACCVPARRAARVDPIVALREE